MSEYIVSFFSNVRTLTLMITRFEILTILVHLVLRIEYVPGKQYNEIEKRARDRAYSALAFVSDGHAAKT